MRKQTIMTFICLAFLGWVAYPYLAAFKLPAKMWMVELQPNAPWYDRPMTLPFEIGISLYLGGISALWNLYINFEAAHFAPLLLGLAMALALMHLRNLLMFTFGSFCGSFPAFLLYLLIHLVVGFSMLNILIPPGDSSWTDWGGLSLFCVVIMVPVAYHVMLLVLAYLFIQVRVQSLVQTVTEFLGLKLS